MARATRPITITPEAAEIIDQNTAVNKETGCWDWAGPISPAGYGMASFGGGVQYLAHRASYTRHEGQIPDGKVLDHLCRNPACINPDHLEPVSDQENVRRGMSPGAKALRRTECLKGHAYAEHGRLVQGRRVCRACAAERLRKFRARKALAKAQAA